MTRAAGLSAGLALATVLAGARPAHASGLSTARFGGEFGQAVTTNPTAIYYNPAGIAEAEGTHLFLDVVAAWRHGAYAHERGPGERPEPADGIGGCFCTYSFWCDNQTRCGADNSCPAGTVCSLSCCTENVCMPACN